MIIDMKRIYLFAVLVAALCFTACNGDYDDWADPQSNAQEDAIAELTSSFTASDVDMTDMVAGDTITVLTLGEMSLSDAEFTPTALLVNGEEVDYTYEDGEFTLIASDLDAIISETYGSRACVDREITIQAEGYAIIDEQGLAVSTDEATITVTPQPTPAVDEAGYYLLGDFEGNSWSLTSPIWMEEVEEDSIYTATVVSTSSTCWYKFYQGSYYDSSDWDVVNLGQMGCATNGDESLTGFIVWNDDAMTSGGVQTPVIPGEGEYTITIDVVNMTYTVVSVSPETWYLVGSGIGDGSWNVGGVDYVGISLYPLAYVEDGVISYTGYFTTDGFKLIKEPDSWGEQWGYSDGYVKNDENSGNLWVDEAGYYTITLDYKNDILTIESYTGTVTEQATMGISGGFNSWGFESIENATGSSHLWRFEFESDSDTELKFLTDSSWATNWGSDTFPSGMGVSNGSNIPVSAGSYIVIFNDIDGGYTFVSK